MSQLLWFLDEDYTVQNPLDYLPLVRDSADDLWNCVINKTAYGTLVPKHFNAAVGDVGVSTISLTNRSS